MKPEPITRTKAHALCNYLLSLTGSKWKPQSREEYYQDFEQTWTAEQANWYLTNQTNTSQALWMDYDRGRYTVRGLLPKHLNQNNVRIYDHPGKSSITVSAGRDIGDIARDISRRLLPDYVDYLLACEASLRQHSAISQRHADIVKSLRAIAPDLKPYGHSQTETEIKLHMNGGSSPSLTLRLSSFSTSDSFRIEISCDQAKTAAAILETISQERNPVS